MDANELLSPKWRDDPYPLYAALREAGPVHYFSSLDAWVLTRHGDIAAALRDGRLSNRRGTAAFFNVAPNLQEATAPFRASLKLWALFRDPPDHTRLRGLLAKAFAPALVETMRGRIERIIDELLEEPQRRGSFEVVSELAYPLPAIVIAETIGAPRADRDLWKRWADDLVTLLAPGIKNPQMMERVLKSWHEMDAYLADLIKERRKAPGHDLLDALLSAEEAGSLLSEEEVRATLALLLFAGHETTMNLISLGVLALLRNPCALEALRDDPSLIPGAIEEMLRYDAPVQLSVRLCGEDLSLCGQPMKKGDRLMLLLASGNRDPQQFREPDRFDVRRRDGRNLAFGQGIHFCLGAGLARLEAQLCFKALLSRFPSLRLSPEADSAPVRFGENLAFRCPTRLSVVA